jgi:restriction endonuclease S subunit
VPAVKNGNLFMVLRGEVENRLDPDMVIYNRKINTFKYPVKQVKHFLKQKPQYGSNQAGIDRISKEEVRYIRITDIDEYGLLKNSLGATVEEVESKYIVNNNDILIARSGATVGKAFIFKEESVDCECIFAGYMIRFILKDAEVLPDFFFVYTQLSVYKEWTKAIQRAAGQPNINAEEYKSLKIPVPPLETQQRIVTIMETAYAAKRQKEAEAKAMLASIDDYLLEELGITLPKVQAKQKVFRVSSNKVSGGRLDPYFHQKEFSELDNILNNSKFQSAKLIQIAKKITSGSTPLSGGDAYTTKDLGIPFIRSGEINEFNLIDFDEVIYIKEEVHNKLLKSSKLQKGDLMIAIVGATIGQVGIYDYDFEANINQAIALVRFDNQYNTEYVKSFFTSLIGQKILDRAKRPVARANINLEEIGDLKIIIPPLEVQNEIATHISNLRSEASALAESAKMDLAAAKAVVEKMILGEV